MRVQSKYKCFKVNFCYLFLKFDVKYSIKLFKGMTHTRQTFLIPQLNVLASDADLRNLQHKMLFNHYSQQSQQKLYRSQSEKKLDKNNFNPEKVSANYQDMKNNAIKRDNTYKKDLANFYEQQIQRKNLKNKEIKMREIVLQQQMIQRAQNQLYLDKQRDFIMRETFKKKALDVINQKQRKKQQQKIKQQQQKRYYQRRYETNLLPLNKSKSFKDHYDNVDGQFAVNTKNFIDQVVLKNIEKQIQKQKLMQVQLQENQRRMRQQLQKERQTSQLFRNNLFNTLTNQIRQKQQKHRLEWEKERSQGYTSQIYSKRHHPINNPVDFKITHDNKYIINELQSGLARRGSQSLL